MNRFFTIPTTLRLALLLAFGAAGQATIAAESPANRLQNLEVQNLSGQGLQVVLTTSGPAAEPLSFTIDNPATISVDLPNTSLALPQRRYDVGRSGLESILTAEGNGRARIVLNLQQMQTYSTRVEGNRVIVTLGQAAVAAAPPAAVPASPAPSMMVANRRISNIDFRRAGDGSPTGRLIVGLSDPRTPINLRQQGNRILVDFAGTDLAPEYQKSYDATDFATPITGFDLIRTPTGTQLVINATGDYEQLSYQSDDQYVVEVQPRRVAKALVEEKPVYTGELMGADFQDVSTRTLLQLIAQAGGVNIIISDSVQGNSTLRLADVPWDQALDVVLRSKGLDKRVEGNVILVGPTEEMAAREKALQDSRKSTSELAPLRLELLQVNYAEAAVLQGLIQAQSASAGAAGKTLLSPRGSVNIDSRTNILIIQDTPDSISNIRALVSQLDIQVKQVEIEARIVIVNEDFQRDLGVRFGFTGTETNGSNGLFAVSGTGVATDTIVDSALSNLAGGGGVYPVTIPTLAGAPSRYNVNMPVTNPAGTLSTIILGSDFLVDLELSAAQAEGKGEVISSPKITASNMEEAYIEQGTEIPYQEAASSGATTTQFKKAVLSLRVTPQINPDNSLELRVIVHKDNVGSQTFNGVPAIETRELATSIVMRDGQTAVLGGIMETERRDSERKVPLLGDIPVLGHLFKSTTKVNNKDELLIFVTPRIKKEGVRIN